MNKLLKNIIVFTLAAMIIVSIPIGNVVLKGYFKFKYVVENIGIEEKICEIQNNQNYIKFEDIDSDFINAIVSIEDHRFYEHDGVDYIGIARATISNIKEGKIVQGGSTITQQLVKNIFLDGDKNYSRKVAELFLTNKIEKIYSKEEILEIYANAVNYGNGYIGIKEASKGYFNVEASNLNDKQAAMLAGILQYPEGYNPEKYYDKAVARQQLVLEAVNKYSSKEYINEFKLKSLEYGMRSLYRERILLM